MSAPLQEYDGVLHSRMGAAFPGSHAIFRGQDLHRDLRDLDWLELYVYGITGRRFTPEQVRLLHGIWVLTSYPDARIWNNRIAALAGSARSTGALGLSAAIAATEARIYGGGAGVRAITFFLRAKRAIDAGQPLRDFIAEELQHRKIYGYGRPIESCDERLPWLSALVQELGMDQGPHFRLALETETILQDMGKTSLRLNYGGMVAALGADLGLSPREYHLFRIPSFLAGMPPCYIEATEKPEGALYAMACDAVQYEGECPRSWPGKTNP